MTTLNKDDLYRIGVITEPHGIKGEFKVYPTTDDPMHIKKIKEIYLDTGKELLPLHPQGVKVQKNLIILKVEEYNDRNPVELLRKKELFVTRENTVKLRKDEYLVDDLIGLKAIDEDGNEVGTIKEVLETGANDVYEITKIDGTSLLLPAIKQCILEVNIDEGYMKVFVMPGL